MADEDSKGTPKGPIERLRAHMDLCGYTPDKMDPEVLRRVAAAPDHCKDLFDQLARRHAEPLLHGIYAPLERLLEQVREYPEVTGDDIQQAQLAVGKEFPNWKTFMRNGRHGPRGLVAVVTVYRDDAHDTFSYAVRRIFETYGRTNVWLDPSHFQGELDARRIRYRRDEHGDPTVSVYRNRVRIEVIDLMAEFSPERGARASRAGRRAAHAGLLYFAAQHPEAMRRMHEGLPADMGLPPILCAGFQIRRPEEGWAKVPRLCFAEGRVLIDARHEEIPLPRFTAPRFWEMP